MPQPKKQFWFVNDRVLGKSWIVPILFPDYSGITYREWPVPRETSIIVVSTSCLNGIFLYFHAFFLFYLVLSWWCAGVYERFFACDLLCKYMHYMQVHAYSTCIFLHKYMNDVNMSPPPPPPVCSCRTTKKCCSLFHNFTVEFTLDWVVPSPCLLVCERVMYWLTLMFFQWQNIARIIVLGAQAVGRAFTRAVKEEVKGQSLTRISFFLGSWVFPGWWTTLLYDVSGSNDLWFFVFRYRRCGMAPEHNGTNKQQLIGFRFDFRFQFNPRCISP